MSTLSAICRTLRTASFAMIVSCVFLAGCQTTDSSDVGSGPLKMSPDVYRWFQHYLENRPLVFAVSEDGETAWYTWCIELGCPVNRFKKGVIYKCENHGTKAKTPCHVFALRDKIVWKNPGDWKPSEEEIEQAKYVPEGELHNRVSELRGYRHYLKRQYGPAKTSDGSKVEIYKAFAVSLHPKYGSVMRWGSFGSRPSHPETEEDARAKAIDFCERRRPKESLPCVVYDVNNEVVFEPPNS